MHSAPEWVKGVTWEQAKQIAMESPWWRQLVKWTREGAYDVASNVVWIDAAMISNVKHN